MNLLEIRKDFVMRSGRYDLATPEWEDNGADFFIRAGQRMLDKKGDFGSGQIATFSYVFKPGDDEVFIPLIWTIQKVIINPKCFGWGTFPQYPHPPACFCRSEEHRHWIEIPRAFSRKAFKCCFGHFDLCYFIRPVRELPRLKGREKASDVDLPASAVQASAGEFSKMEKEQGLWLQLNLPPRHRWEIPCVVYGKFFSESLRENEDVNYWSEQHPETLLKAALYELEVFYRNSEGANDWLNAVLVDLQDIEQMQVFQDIQEKDEMEGFY